ncbi:unnamed protein product, partial [Effrenium voratum]
AQEFLPLALHPGASWQLTRDGSASREMSTGKESLFWPSPPASPSGMRQLDSPCRLEAPSARKRAVASALQTAVQSGSVQQVQAVLELDPAAILETADQPICQLTQNCEVLRLLLRHGAQVDDRDRTGHTALSLLCAGQAAPLPLPFDFLCAWPSCLVESNFEDCFALGTGASFEDFGSKQGEQDGAELLDVAAVLLNAGASTEATRRGAPADLAKNLPKLAEFVLCFQAAKAYVACQRSSRGGLAGEVHHLDSALQKEVCAWLAPEGSAYWSFLHYID